MGQLMTVSGKVASEMGTGSKNGQMELDMKATGKTIELMVRANSRTSMVTCMKAIGLPIRPMATVFTPM